MKVDIIKIFINKLLNSSLISVGMFLISAVFTHDIWLSFWLGLSYFFLLPIIYWMGEVNERYNRFNFLKNHFKKVRSKNVS